MRNRLLFVSVLMLAGCSQSGSNSPVEFVLRDVPSKSISSHQGIDIYELSGHGRSCYIAAFGVSKVLLWCERTAQ